MTFDSIANVNAAGSTAFGVKISFGNDIRRASCTAATYPALCELVARLFNLDQASLVFKYQDDDGDKITMVCPPSLFSKHIKLRYFIHSYLNFIVLQRGASRSFASEQGQDHSLVC